MLLSKKAKKLLLCYNAINSQIITVRFNPTSFNVTMIHVYALISDSSEDDIETFYDNLEDAVAKTPKNDLVIITGYWNAKWEGTKKFESPP